MKQRSQIFLLLTILVIAFIVGISSTLIDLKKTTYNDPAPQAQEFYRTWDSTLRNLEEVLVFTLAQRSNASLETTGQMQDAITDKLLGIENYLLNRGFSAKITLLTTIIENTNYQKNG